MALTESTRRGLFTHAAACYHDQPEYLWATAPNYAVLRHPENRKWYALVMDLPREKLGLPGGGITDVVELKCDPAMAGSLRGRPGILPGYHMNRENWITVLLDGSFDPGQLAFLLDISHSLTGLRRQKAKAPRLNRDWLIPANPAYYDIEQDLGRDGHILWKQTARVQAGDTVYIYMAARCRRCCTSAPPWRWTCPCRTPPPAAAPGIRCACGWTAALPPARSAGRCCRPTASAACAAPAA